ncbi:MFS transporter [Glycomyces sp. NPDC047369]
MGARTVRFRDVFAVREFRILWIAQVQSRIGDQFARVALALLVFERTSSAALTALVYAMTLLPPLLTAPLLTGLADRYSRRTVMVVVDLLRAVLAAAMAIPAVPLPVLAVLVVAATCPQPLFAAARTATTPRILPDERYPVGTSIMVASGDIAQIAGFALGGLVVGTSGGPHLALGLNAVSFALSAAMLRWGLAEHRPEPGPGAAGRVGFALAGIRYVSGDRRLLGLAGMLWLFGCFVVPEALAAPYAKQIGAGDAEVGLLMAANVVGAAIGAIAVAKFGPTLRRRLIVPMAFATGIPLVATMNGPSLPVTLALWALSGLLANYMVLTQVSFTQSVPDGLRARAIGFAGAGLQTAQGLGVVAGGALAETMAPSTAIAVCAAAGSVGALLIGAASGLGAAPQQLPEAASAAAPGPPSTSAFERREPSCATANTAARERSSRPRV